LIAPLEIEPASCDWDVVVVGGGMGGGTISWRLASAGLRVLLIERGQAVDGQNQPDLSETNQQKRESSGIWPTMLRGSIDGKISETWPYLGCGLGGSSLLYGGALQRFDEQDFLPHEFGSGRLSGWPFRYDELLDNYRLAERVFRVHGAGYPSAPADKLSDLLDPMPMSDADRALYKQFGEAGLHPFRLHVARNGGKACGFCADGSCTMRCRMDSFQACIKPAAETNYLQVLDQTEAVRVEFNQRSAEHLEVKRGTQSFRIQARVFVVAAGALFTPKILLKSKTSTFPNGVGNQSGCLGRNLMFHASDFFALWPAKPSSITGFSKSLAFRDLYWLDGVPYGEVQSMGFAANQNDILQYLHDKFWQSPFRHLPFLRHSLRLPAMLASRAFQHAMVFSSIVQDLPYGGNRVEFCETAPCEIRYTYTISDELRERIFAMRRLLDERWQNIRYFRLNRDLSLNLGHPCGTCRADLAPSSGVVDEHFRVHETDNLYVADASVFPTSGGTNPSLTVAACALRCADQILRSLGVPAMHDGSVQAS